MASGIAAVGGGFAGKPCGMQLLDYDGPEPTLLKGEKNLVDAIENGGALAKSGHRSTPATAHRFLQKHRFLQNMPRRACAILLSNLRRAVTAMKPHRALPERLLRGRNLLQHCTGRSASLSQTALLGTDT